MHNGKSPDERRVEIEPSSKPKLPVVSELKKCFEPQNAKHDDEATSGQDKARAPLALREPESAPPKPLSKNNEETKVPVPVESGDSGSSKPNTQPVKSSPSSRSTSGAPYKPNQNEASIFGIEGKLNSCYIDSVFSAMFLCHPQFKEYVAQTPPGNGLSQKISEILSERVIAPLYKNKRLPCKDRAIADLRNAMSMHDKTFESQQKDPEELVRVLFGDILRCPPFTKFDDGGGCHVFQTYYDKKRLSQSTIGLQTLLDHTFGDNGIQLSAQPKPGFIIKLPISNGKSVIDEIIPNYEINLKRFLKVDAPESRTRMCLAAAICLKKNHFTTFVRTGGRDSPWVFLDSFNFKSPEIIKGFKDHLENSIVQDLYIKEKELRWLKYLLRTVYMCIYLPLELT